MNEVRETKQYKATKSLVPSFLGPDRNKAIVVRVTPQGVWIKPKGAQKNGVVYVSWEEIYSFGIIQDAKRKVAQK